MKEGGNCKGGGCQDTQFKAIYNFPDTALVTTYHHVSINESHCLAA